MVLWKLSMSIHDIWWLPDAVFPVSAISNNLVKAEGTTTGAAGVQVCASLCCSRSGVRKSCATCGQVCASLVLLAFRSAQVLCYSHLDLRKSVLLAFRSAQVLCCSHLDLRKSVLLVFRSEQVLCFSLSDVRKSCPRNSVNIYRSKERSVLKL